jgi:hypothetical protein
MRVRSGRCGRGSRPVAAQTRMKRSVGSRYRAGPWPGLTPAGAGVILACAVFLAIGQLLVGPPTRPVPDLAVTAATALLPLAIATRLVQMPGAAVAASGAYLLPASLIGLLFGSTQPPLLLVSAMLFEIALWLDESGLLSRTPAIRLAKPTRRRAVFAGALFGLALCVVEPPFRVLLGGDPTTWSTPNTLIAAALAAPVCAALATVVSGPDTAA